MSPRTPLLAMVNATGTGLTLDGPSRARLASLAGQRVTIAPVTRTRTSAQNRRHWTLMTVGAKSLWEDPGERQTLHDELAHLYFGLPPCPKTGLRRRRRTPHTDTKEFAAFTDWCVMKLVELGADLSEWDTEIERATA